MQTHSEQHFSAHPSSPEAGSCSVQTKPWVQAVILNTAELTGQVTNGGMVWAQTGALLWMVEKSGISALAVPLHLLLKRLKLRVQPEAPVPAAMHCTAHTEVDVC